jgi:hypothetical protein
MGKRCVLLLAMLALVPAPANALRIGVRYPQPFVYVQVGHGLLSDYGLFGPPAGLVDEVVFNFPPGVRPGDGTLVIGNPVMPVAFVGYSGRGRVNFLVTMNSAAGLRNGNGDTMPFSEISWTTRDGDIPGGQFNDSASQLLQQYDLRGRARTGVVDFLTFSYRNTRVYPAGSYTGRVTYTITAL